MSREYQIKYAVLCSKMGYGVAAMHAARGELVAMQVELVNSRAPTWVLRNIRHNLQGVAV